MKWLLAVFSLALGFAASPAGAGTISAGVGVFGGINIPIVQDDNGQGSSYGFRVPVAIHHVVTLEPYFATTSDGDVTQTILGTSYTRSGFSISSYGVNALLTLGSKLQFYPFATAGTNKLTRVGSADQTMTGVGGGLGFGFSPVPKFMVHVRGAAQSMTQGGSGRLFADVTAGVSYALYPFAKN
jgi:hypothetical protein